MKLLTLFTQKFVFMFLKNLVLTSLEHTQCAVEFHCPIRGHNNMLQSFVFNFIPISSILNSARICMTSCAFVILQGICKCSVKAEDVWLVI